MIFGEGLVTSNINVSGVVVENNNVINSNGDIRESYKNVQVQYVCLHLKFILYKERNDTF